MLRVSQVNQSIDEPMERLHQRICKKLRIRERDLIRFSIYRESVDARRRPIRFSYVVDCCLLYTSSIGALLGILLLRCLQSVFRQYRTRRQTHD